MGRTATAAMRKKETSCAPLSFGTLALDVESGKEMDGGWMQASLFYVSVVPRVSRAEGGRACERGECVVPPVSDRSPSTRPSIASLPPSYIASSPRSTGRRQSLLAPIKFVLKDLCRSHPVVVSSSHARHQANTHLHSGFQALSLPSNACPHLKIVRFI